MTHIEGIESRLQNWIRSVQDSLTTAEVHFSIYWAIREFQGGEQGLKTLNRAPGFWMSTSDAHRDRGILLLWKILADQDKRSRSIPSLLRYVMSVPEVFTFERFRSRNSDPVLVDDLYADYEPPNQDWMDGNQHLLDQIRIEIKSISKWRNLRVAHTDARVIEGKFKLSEQAPLDRESLGVLIDTARNLINRVSLMFNANESTSGAAPSDIRLHLDLLLGRESAP